MLLINNILFVINICIFIMYHTKILDTTNICSKTFLNNIAQNYTHLDITHIMFNLYALYNLSNLEVTYGTSKYLNIILLLTVMQSVLTYIYNKYNETNCSIGFSGVIFGLYIYVFFKNQDINTKNIIIALTILIYPSLYASNVSLSGHLFGGLCGFILSILY